MSRKRTVPRFEYELSSSQGDETISCSLVSQSQTPAPKLRRGIRLPRPAKKAGLVLTVSLPKHGNKSSDKRSKFTGLRWGLEPQLHQNETTVSQREYSQSSGHGSDSVVKEDAYAFSQGKQPKNEREKIKTAVLRNIARMLAENNHIRQRLESLSQVNCSHTKP